MVVLAAKEFFGRQPIGRRQKSAPHPPDINSGPFTSWSAAPHLGLDCPAEQAPAQPLWSCGRFCPQAQRSGRGEDRELQPAWPRNRLAPPPNCLCWKRFRPVATYRELRMAPRRSDRPSPGAMPSPGLASPELPVLPSSRDSAAAARSRSSRGAGAAGAGIFAASGWKPPRMRHSSMHTSSGRAYFLCCSRHASCFASDLLLSHV